MKTYVASDGVLREFDKNRGMDPEMEQKPENKNLPTICTDAYDPYLDPLFRTVLRWFQKSRDQLEMLALVPISPVAVAIFRRHGDASAHMRSWSFRPHKNPSLQLTLATSFRMVKIKVISGEPDTEDLRFPFKESQEWLTLLDETITVTELVNAT